MVYFCGCFSELPRIIKVKLYVFEYASLSMLVFPQCCCSILHTLKKIKLANTFYRRGWECTIPPARNTHTCSKPAGRLMQFKAVHHHRLKQEEECSLMLNKSLCLLLKGRLRVINSLPHTVNACVRYKQPHIVWDTKRRHCDSLYLSYSTGYIII